MTRKRTRSPAEQPLTSAIRPVPVLHHLCPSCGRYVIYRRTGTRGRWTYVRCPACGQRHALDLEQQTSREVAS